MDIVTYGEFEEKVLGADGSVLVDFYASLCGPCRTMIPVVNELTEAGGFSVYKVDVDKVTEAADRFGVASVPTFVAFRNGIETARLVGTASKHKLIELMDKA